jgi:hypothetical protein
MKKAYSLVRLDGESIDGDAVSCTGKQLAALLDAIAPPIQDCVWFIADLELLGSPTEPRFSSPEPVRYGSTEALRKFIFPVDQILSGVFLAVSNQNVPPTWSRLYWTDEEPFTTIDDAEIEIRAFDTSYFEIVTANSDVLLELSNHYGSMIDLQHK